MIVIQVVRDMPTTEIWRALYGAASLHRAAGKYIIAVNDDIDPENADALFACPHVDGALVGGASLEAASFMAIAQSASNNLSH